MNVEKQNDYINKKTITIIFIFTMKKHIWLLITHYTFLDIIY